MTRRVLILLVLLVAVSAVPASRAYAHHSFAATYLADEVITIDGELAQILYRNPHSFLHVLVHEKGSDVRYAVEWRGAAELDAQGVPRQSLRPGDHVIITGNPGRNPADHRMRMNSLYRPKDGLRWKLPDGAQRD